MNIMKNLLATTASSIVHNTLAYRQVIPVAIIVTLVVLSLLLPGTVLAGAGSSSAVCGSC